MKKRSKRQKLAMILALVLAALLVLPMLISALIPPAGAAVTQKDIDKRKDDQKVYKDQLVVLQGKIDKLKDQRANAMEIKAAIDEQIEVKEKEIENNNLLIQDLNVRLAQQQEELTKATEKERQASEMFALRLRVMEEAGDVSYLAILFESASFSDLLGRIDLINEVMEADGRLMENLAQARVEVEAVKAQLQQDKDDQFEVSKQLAASQAELAEQYAEIDDVIADLRGDLTKAEDAYKKAAEEEKKALDDVNKMMAQWKKEQEAKKKSTQYVGGELLFPVPGYTIGAGDDYKFGMRYHPILKRERMHTGVDIPAPRGTPIVAANDGMVLVAEKHSSYGNYVVIDHGGGRATLYAHMSKMGTSKGKTVKRGETIGYVGSTGLSTGDHLHFEVIIDGVQKNPEPYLKSR